MDIKRLVRSVLLDRLFQVGVGLLIVGTGPLVVWILIDPKANPVGPGILTFLTFWPSVLLTVVGLVRGMAKGLQPTHEGPGGPDRP